MKKKENKVYNLATKIQETQLRLLSNHEPRYLNQIIELPENQNCQNSGKANNNINMFTQQICEKQQLFKQTLPYEIVGKKQVEAYKLRQKKNKSKGLPNILKSKVSDSFLSSSKQTLYDSGINNCLTKKQLSQYYQILKENQHSTTGLQNHNSLIQKIKSQRNKTINLFQIKSKHRKYQSGWQTMRLRTSRSNQRELLKQKHRLNSLNNSKHTESVANLQSERKKIENLEKITLNWLKQNIKPIYWKDNLRNPLGLKHTFDKKYVQNIQRQGINLRGANKLNKQYDWLKNKKIDMFQSLEGRQKFIKRKTELENPFNRIQFNDLGNTSGNRSESRVIPFSCIE